MIMEKECVKTNQIYHISGHSLIWNGILNAVGMEHFQSVGSKEEISSKKCPFERIALLNDRDIFSTTIVCFKNHEKSKKIEKWSFGCLNLEPHNL